MKFREIFKSVFENKKVFIALCVVALTSLTIGTSYSAFFSVKHNKSNQTITTGTLSVSYTQNETAINNENMMPMTDEEGLNRSDSRIIYVQNTGTLDSTYFLTVGYDMDAFLSREDYSDDDVLTPVEYIKIAVYEYDSASKTDTLISGPLTLADLPFYEYNDDHRHIRYSLMFDNVGSATSGSATKTYKVKLWLSDEAGPALSNTFFYINTEIVAEVETAKMSYNLSGVLTDIDDNIYANATINLHNGSIVTTTDASGNFTLNNVPQGLFNVNINYSEYSLTSTINIDEGNSLAIRRLPISYNPNGETRSIFDVVNEYKTVIGNVIDTGMFSNDIYYGPTGGYSFNNVFEIVGSENEDIGILRFELDFDEGFELAEILLK